MFIRYEYEKMCECANILANGGVLCLRGVRMERKKVYA